MRGREWDVHVHKTSTFDLFSKHEENQMPLGHSKAISGSANRGLESLTAVNLCIDSNIYVGK